MRSQHPLGGPQPRRGRAIAHSFVPPRNLGEGAQPRQDQSLVLLPPIVEKPKTWGKPPLRTYPRAPPGRQGTVTFGTNEIEEKPEFPPVADPNLNKWRSLNTDAQMQTMMALQGGGIDRGDRGVLIDWFEAFKGESGKENADYSRQEPWLFFPGGWHAGQGWWDDAGVAYSIEAATMKDERQAEVALLEEKEERLSEAHERCEMAFEDVTSKKFDPFWGDKWASLGEEGRAEAERWLVFAQRGVVPKRLHLVTAGLQRAMGESRRSRLKPLGRHGLPSVSDWHGVKVNAKFRQIFALALPYHRISGYLGDAVKKFFVKLKGIAELHLVGNLLRGPIPSEISQLRGLRLLLLRSNQLEGRLPDSLGSLRQLVALDVSRNRLTGPLPTTLEDLANLQVLSVGDNVLSGPIQCIDGLTKIKPLRYLDLSGNCFTGSLSAQFQEMRSLRVLNLSRNQLQGGLPGGLGQLRELVSLDVSRNRLSGSLPLRPRVQPLLHQMKLHGNPDLLAPDNWVRSQTLRFQLEHGVGPHGSPPLEGGGRNLTAALATAAFTGTGAADRCDRSLNDPRLGSALVRGGLGPGAVTGAGAVRRAGLAAAPVLAGPGGLPEGAREAFARADRYFKTESAAVREAEAAAAAEEEASFLVGESAEAALGFAATADFDETADFAEELAELGPETGEGETGQGAGAAGGLALGSRAAVAAVGRNLFLAATGGRDPELCDPEPGQPVFTFADTATSLGLDWPAFARAVGLPGAQAAAAGAPPQEVAGAQHRPPWERMGPATASDFGAAARADLAWPPRPDLASQAPSDPLLVAKALEPDTKPPRWLPAKASQAQLGGALGKTRFAAAREAKSDQDLLMGELRTLELPPPSENAGDLQQS